MENFTLLTGASGGLGNATAIKLSTSQKLILSGRNEDELKKLRAKCYNPEEHLIWQCDFNKIENIKPSLSAFLENNQIAIDKLVYSSGKNYVSAMRNFDYIQMQEIMNINLYAPLEIIKILLNNNINHNVLNNVVILSSISAITGGKGNVFYAASKGAVISAVKSMAVELAPKIRVNTVLPGMVMTKMSREIYSQKMADDIYKNYPLGEGKPKDIANAIEYLLSEKSRWMSGQSLIIDGAFTA